MSPTNTAEACYDFQFVCMYCGQLFSEKMDKKEWLMFDEVMRVSDGRTLRSICPTCRAMQKASE
jgi:hypothetical protein